MPPTILLGVSRSGTTLLKEMPAEPVFPDAVGAFYSAYARLHGKARFGDKTPSYTQRLELLERAFPGAR